MYVYVVWHYSYDTARHYIHNWFSMMVDEDDLVPMWCQGIMMTWAHYAKLSRAMWAPWVDRFFKQWNLLLSFVQKVVQTTVKISSGQAIQGDRNLRPAAT